MRIFLILVLLFILGCALPREEQELKLAIPNDEIAAINLLREGLVLFGKNRFVDAELKFRQAELILPDSDIIKQNLAASLRAQGAEEEAEKLVLELLKVQEKRDYLLSLASIYSSQNKYEEATEIWEKVFVSDASKGKPELLVKTLQNLGAAEFYQGNDQAALCYYEQRANLLPEPLGQLQFARFLISYGNSPRAFNLLQDLTERFPNNNDPELWYLYSLAAFESEEFKTAAEAWYFSNLFIQSRPDLAIKIELLKNALLEVFPEVKEYQDLLSVNLPQKSLAAEEEQDAQRVKQELILKAYEATLYSAESLYLPATLLEIYEDLYRQLKSELEQDK